MIKRQDIIPYKECELRPPALNLTGRRFGYLVVVKYLGKANTGGSVWECTCICGKVLPVKASPLSLGRTKHCGCKYVNPNQSHGMSNTKIYRVWHGMIERCYDKNHKYYYNYGGRGITVCKKWRQFVGFYEDMNEGYKEGLSLDRIKNNKIYKKSNCKWSNRHEQDRNKRTNKWETYKGMTMIKNDWAKYLGVAISTINSFISNRKCSFGDAVDYYEIKHKKSVQAA